MKKVLTKKEFLFLAELEDILLKYNAVIQSSKDGQMQILVHDGESGEGEYPIPVEFPNYLDEEDIEILFAKNNILITELGINPSCSLYSL